jgi:hypothetical protein
MALKSPISKPFAPSVSDQQNTQPQQQLRQFTVSDETVDFDNAPIPGIPPRGQRQQAQQRQQPIQSTQENIQQQRNKNRYDIPEGAILVDHNEIKKLREAAIQEQQLRERGSQNILKERIEYLTGIGRKRKDVPIPIETGVITYHLQTLKGEEKYIVSDVTEQSQGMVIQVRNAKGDLEQIKVPTNTSLNKIKKATLGFALYGIDQQDINGLLGVLNYDENEQYEARKEFIGNMDDALTDHLFREYNKMILELQDGYAKLGNPEVLAEAISKSGEVG